MAAVFEGFFRQQHAMSSLFSCGIVLAPRNGLQGNKILGPFHFLLVSLRTLAFRAHKLIGKKAGKCEAKFLIQIQL